MINLIVVVAVLAVLAIALLVWASVIQSKYSNQTCPKIGCDSCCKTSACDSCCKKCAACDSCCKAVIDGVVVSAMTFNIKTTNGEGDLQAWNKWLIRKGSVFDLITEANPDLLSTQEVTRSTQEPELSEKLSTYTRSGDFRATTNDAEGNFLYFKTAKFTLDSSVTIHYNNTLPPPPEDAYPRIFTVTKLTHVNNNKKIMVISTQLSRKLMGETFQKAQCDQLIAYVTANAGEYSPIIMGDWNPPETFNGFDYVADGLNLNVDHSVQSGSVGTRIYTDQTGFVPESTAATSEFINVCNAGRPYFGRKFDAVIFPKHFTVLSATICRYLRGYNSSWKFQVANPSDHSPVIVSFIV